jgi:hypothetical protein
MKKVCAIPLLFKLSFYDTEVLLRGDCSIRDREREMFDGGVCGCSLVEPLRQLE